MTAKATLADRVAHLEQRVEAQAELIGRLLPTPEPPRFDPTEFLQLCATLVHNHAEGMEYIDNGVRIFGIRVDPRRFYEDLNTIDDYLNRLNPTETP